MPAPAILAAIPILGEIVGRVVDRILPDEQAAAQAKLQAMAILQTEKLSELDAVSNVIMAEAKSESWLTRSWRPITMLTFVGLIVSKWLGFTAPGISEALELQLLEIIKIGLGGYVLGRSAERVAQVWQEKK